MSYLNSCYSETEMCNKSLMSQKERFCSNLVYHVLASLRGHHMSKVSYFLLSQFCIIRLPKTNVDRHRAVYFDAQYKGHKSDKA